MANWVASHHIAQSTNHSAPSSEKNEVKKDEMSRDKLSVDANFTNLFFRYLLIVVLVIYSLLKMAAENRDDMT